MMAAAQSSCWPDLPPELLGVVLKCLPYLGDRVRLRAVCEPWRSNSRQFLPPPLPWLALPDGTFLTIPDGEIIRMPIPDDARCYGSVDNWLFIMKSDGDCSLMNPFSKATLDLPKPTTITADARANESDYQLVVASPLGVSPDSIVVMRILCSHNIFICQHQNVTDTMSGRYGRPLFLLEDVEFFEGKLYGIAFCQKLLLIEIDDGPQKEPKISSVQCLIEPKKPVSKPKHLLAEAHTIKQYLVKSIGRLLVVVRWLGEMAPPTGPTDGVHERTVAFQVFEADLSIKPGQWRRVNKLCGQALFLSKRGSKSFPAGESNGIQEDSIYFMCDYAIPGMAEDPLRDSGVYNLSDGTIKPLLSETATVPVYRGGEWRATWFFPTDAV